MVGEVCVVKTGVDMSEHMRTVKSLIISISFSVFVLVSGCWSQDALLSDRALREIGFDSTEVLSTRVLWNDVGRTASPK
jgi:hypothetical protein